MQNNNIKIKMKKFRSSKVLKPIDPQTKEQSQLRAKIKNLQQQIEMLQKSNLNIFIPLSEHAVQPTIDYQSIIRQLKHKIGSLQNENQAHKYTIKKLEREKEQIKKEMLEELEKKKIKIQSLQDEINTYKGTIEELEEEVEAGKKKMEELEREVIQKNVELKFMAEELFEEKAKSAHYSKKLEELNGKVNAVLYSSRVHNSLNIKAICLEKTEYDALKKRISDLQAEIQRMKSANYREIITLGNKKSDIGEQIVRLKKNIDMQLGIQGTSKHSEEFLKIYQGTQHMINDLLQKCRT